MTEPSKNLILNERVKPAMLNPLVKYITVLSQSCFSESLGVCKSLHS
jgi:hypothetical protein